MREFRLRVSFDKTVVSTVAYAWASGNNKDLGKPGIRRVSDGETKESVCRYLAMQWRDVCLTFASDTSSAPDLGLEHSARQVHRECLVQIHSQIQRNSGPPSLGELISP